MVGNTSTPWNRRPAIACRCSILPNHHRTSAQAALCRNMGFPRQFVGRYELCQDAKGNVADRDQTMYGHWQCMSKVTHFQQLTLSEKVLLRTIDMAHNVFCRLSASRRPCKWPVWEEKRDL